MPYVPPVRRKRKPGAFGQNLPRVLLGLAAVFYLLCFLHLRADFPHGTPWLDASASTAEGSYANGALHHFLFGHWFLPGAFNTAVALPVWPILLGLWFKLTGVSLEAARILTLLIYLGSLVVFYALLHWYRPGLMPAVTVGLMAINPFCYAFNRVAILEPLLVLLFVLALWFAANIRDEEIWKQAALGAVLFVLVLTRTSGFFLWPAVLVQLISTIGWPPFRTILAMRKKEDLRPFRAPGIALATGLLLWLIYLASVLPHFHADYALAFASTPGHVPVHNLPDATVGALADGLWMSRALWISALAIIFVSLFWLRELWRTPIYASSVIAIAGYLAVILYHGNTLAADYLVVAMPVVAIVLLGIDSLWQRKVDGVAAFIAVVLIFTSIAMMFKTVRWVLKPDYTFATAAESIAQTIRADHEAKPLLLSSSGDEIALITRIPALDKDHTTQGLDPLLSRYQPGWAALWDDEDTAALDKRYKLAETSRYTVLDNPDHDTLVLYRLDKP